MARELSTDEGITWACVEAYAGLSENAGNKNLARVEGSENLVQVVCTPSGGAQTVRLRLPKDWESKYSDEELLREIKARQEKEA
jgi:hypothetical protein